jgi:hypothetical protein
MVAGRSGVEEFFEWRRVTHCRTRRLVVIPGLDCLRGASNVIFDFLY